MLPKLNDVDAEALETAATIVENHLQQRKESLKVKLVGLKEEFANFVGTYIVIDMQSDYVAHFERIAAEAAVGDLEFLNLELARTINLYREAGVVSTPLLDLHLEVVSMLHDSGLVGKLRLYKANYA